MQRRAIGCRHHPMATVAVMALDLAAGCGDSRGLHTGAEDGAATITMANCTWPSCVTGLLATCVPSGQCTAQADTIKGTVIFCYANGVKIEGVATTTPSLVETCKNGSTVSYSIETRTLFTGGIASGDAFTIKDGSGTTVATGTLDSSSTTVTCSTGPTFVLPAACGTPSPRGVDKPDGGGFTTMCEDSPACIP